MWMHGVGIDDGGNGFTKHMNEARRGHVSGEWLFTYLAFMLLDCLSPVTAWGEPDVTCFLAMAVWSES